MTTLARRYQLLEVLGRGAYGEVREARDVLTGERVAVKLFHGIEADDAARVRREIATLRRLRIPGVVRLLDEGADGDTTFFVMERVDGVAFPGRRGAVAWSELARPALSLAETLARIHEAGVVHHDLKPGNVLVGADGRTTVLDFGIARGLIERRRAVSLEGTPAYLSPEQLMGDPITPRADLFSLGVMLYEALTGALPFTGNNAHGVMLARLTEVPSTLRALGVAAPERVSVLVARMLARRPEDRPRSAWEVVALLRGDAAVMARTDAHPWLGSRACVDALAARCLVGERSDLLAPPGAGRSRVLREVASSLQAAGREVRWLAAGALPFESVEAALGGVAGYDALSLDAMSQVVTGALDRALARGVALLVDDAEGLDAHSIAALARCRGAVLCAWRDDGGAAPPGAVRLDPWRLDEVATFIAGHERVFHLPSDVARVLVERTGGYPGRVVTELDAWARAGLAAWADARAVVTRDALEHLRDAVVRVEAAGARPSLAAAVDAQRRDVYGLLAWVELAGPHARADFLAAAMGVPRWRVEATARTLERERLLTQQPDGRYIARAASLALLAWTDDERRHAHARVAALLRPGDDRRLGHLLAAGDDPAGFAVAVAREGVACASRRVAAGDVSAAIGALSEALSTLYAQRDANAPGVDDDSIASVLVVWLATAVADGTPYEIDRVVYELCRSGLPASVTAPWETLARAALALHSDVRRAGALAATVRFDDPALERARQHLRVLAARAASPDDEAVLLDELVAWSIAPSASSRAAWAGWLGRLRYRQGRFAEAAAQHERAAALEPLVADRIAALRNAASAHMEAFALDEALALAREALGLAASHRLAHLEARAEWLVRCVRYRRGEALAPDYELLEAIDALGVADLEALALSLEAAVAWRAGDDGARELATRALKRWQSLGRDDNARLMRCLLASLGEALDAEAEAAMCRWAATCRVMGFGAQALGLLAGGDDEVFETLAREVPREHHRVRLDVLSVDEARERRQRTHGAIDDGTQP